ncbi:MAG: hypothetical protein IJ538_02565 [Clostridia bacterium]|nr:hypothetical protein [Clostridia bacterium]
MAKIFIEKKEIKFKVKETIEDTSFEVVDGQYVENTKLNRRYTSDIYSYVDFNVLFAMENLFDEFYIKIILFNDERKIGYNLLSLSNNLDISVKRLSPKNFLVLGINKDQETQGQASFCTLQTDGTVNEVTINFNYINQYKVIEKTYFLLNYIETFEEGTGDEKRKTYVNTIGVYREDGSIVKIVYDEKINSKRDLVCEIENGSLLIYYKDDGSVVKKISVADILISKD